MFHFCIDIDPKSLKLRVQVLTDMSFRKSFQGDVGYHDRLNGIQAHARQTFLQAKEHGLPINIELQFLPWEPKDNLNGVYSTKLSLQSLQKFVTFLIIKNAFLL